MREFVDRLTPRERTILSVLLGASILFAAVFVYVFLQERPAARRLTARLAESAADLPGPEPGVADGRSRMDAMDAGPRDLAELKADPVLHGRGRLPRFPARPAGVVRRVRRLASTTWPSATPSSPRTASAG